MEKITPGRYRMRNGKAVQVVHCETSLAYSSDSKSWFSSDGAYSSAGPHEKDLVARLPDYPISFKVVTARAVACLDIENRPTDRSLRHLVKYIAKDLGVSADGLHFEPAQAFSSAYIKFYLFTDDDGDDLVSSQRSLVRAKMSDDPALGDVVRIKIKINDAALEINDWPRIELDDPLTPPKRFQRIGFAVEELRAGDLVELDAATGEVRRTRTGGATNGTN